MTDIYRLCYSGTSSESATTTTETVYYEDIFMHTNKNAVIIGNHFVKFNDQEIDMHDITSIVIKDNGNGLEIDEICLGGDWIISKRAGEE